MLIKKFCEKYLEKHKDETVTFLKSTYLFENFSEEEIHLFISEISLSKREMAKNEKIVQEGQIGHTMYIVYKGTIKISINNDEIETVIADNLSEGSIFGEIALLNDVTRTATVTAKEPTTLYAIIGKDLDKLHKLPKISNKFYINVSKKLSEDISKTNKKLKAEQENLIKCNNEKKVLEDKIEQLSLKLEKLIKKYEQ